MTKVNVEFVHQIKKPANPGFVLRKMIFTPTMRNYSVIYYTVCAKLSDSMRVRSPRSGMAVIELEIPTGYIVTNDVLRNYAISGKVPTLRHCYRKDKRVFFHLAYVRVPLPYNCIRYYCHMTYDIGAIVHKSSELLITFMLTIADGRRNVRRTEGGPLVPGGQHVHPEPRARLRVLRAGHLRERRVHDVHAVQPEHLPRVRLVPVCLLSGFQRRVRSSPAECSCARVLADCFAHRSPSGASVTHTFRIFHAF